LKYKNQTFIKKFYFSKQQLIANLTMISMKMLKKDKG